MGSKNTKVIRPPHDSTQCLLCNSKGEIGPMSTVKSGKNKYVNYCPEFCPCNFSTDSYWIHSSKNHFCYYCNLLDVTSHVMETCPNRCPCKHDPKDENAKHSKDQHTCGYCKVNCPPTHVSKNCPNRIPKVGCARNK